MMPTEGFSDQVTAVLGLPLMVTMNAADWPPLSVTEEGVSAIPAEGRSVTVAWAVFVESA